jgi:hypothetical protein
MCEISEMVDCHFVSLGLVRVVLLNHLQIILEDFKSVGFLLDRVVLREFVFEIFKLNLSLIHRLSIEILLGHIIKPNNC